MKIQLLGGELEPGCKLSLGYKEDVQDLRSSTEELDLQDPIHEQDLTREIRRARKRKEDGTQSECGASIKHLDKERNNSVCSEIILLNISGRTSRLSSVGSQGSGISGKLSAVSNASSRYKYIFVHYYPFDCFNRSLDIYLIYCKNDFIRFF